MTDTGTTTDLSTLTAAETVAYLRDNPGDIEAVRASETSRDQPRATVLAALESTAEAVEVDPVGDYPERPLEEALSDEAKAELVERGDAKGTGDKFEILDHRTLGS